MTGTSLARKPLGLPRMLYLDPLGLGGGTLEASLAGAAGLGFSHVMMPPPFLPGPGGDRFRVADFRAMHPALRGVRGVAELAALAGSHGLGLLLDVPLDRLALGSVAAELGGTLFAPSDPPVPDPRLAPPVPFAAARLDTPERAAALGKWWGERLRGWAAEGVAGFRLLEMQAGADETLAAWLAPIRAAVPAALLLGWTPGMRRSAMAALAGLGLDGVFPSLAWWDGHSAWLWDEIELLGGVAPLIGAPEAPMGARLTLHAHDPARLAPLHGSARALAFGLGGGWLLLEGLARADRTALDPRGGTRPETLPVDFSPEIAAGNAVLAAQPVDGGLSLPLGDGGPMLALAVGARVTVVNTDLETPRALDVSALARAAGAGGFRALLPAAAAVAIGDTPMLVPGGSMVLEPVAAAPSRAPPAPDLAAAPAVIAIEAVSPTVDAGAFPVRRVVGDLLRVQADILADGHGLLAAALAWRETGAVEWREAAMAPLGNDRWGGEFPLPGLGIYEYRVVAWRDRAATLRDEIGKKRAAGQDVATELAEAAALSDGERQHAVASEVFAVAVERRAAQFAAWYELFPRSMSDDPARHGNFRDVIGQLPRIAAMGFDVLYFPPIHPIGRKNRKGRNNALTATPDDPGSPYAIGSVEGGHDAIHPELGTLADFHALREAAAARGLELAVDFAIQCAPDHPWLTEHPDWFDWRPDGTIRYAENPPKKYEDIVNVDFFAAGALPSLWEALRDVVRFWAGQGVRVFRVDNPHTKPFPFWEWMIAEVRREYPDAIFLAEAFTRPKIMERLAKIGFSQSYTYFTWRNTKAELTEYLTELTGGPAREFFRPHFFVNTPDINPPFLQTGGRPAFLIRAALAATLSGLWGMYCGFELCEARAIPGREEYLDSEKYQLRQWDWDRPGNITAEIAALNRIRRRNPALQTHLGITFLAADSEAILYFEKATPDRSNVLLVAVNLDPFAPHSATLDVPMWRWSLPDDGAVVVEDLAAGTEEVWRGRARYVTLAPGRPYAIWRARVAA